MTEKSFSVIKTIVESIEKIFSIAMRVTEAIEKIFSVTMTGTEAIEKIFSVAKMVIEATEKIFSATRPIALVKMKIICVMDLYSGSYLEAVTIPPTSEKGSAMSAGLFVEPARSHQGFFGHFTINPLSCYLQP